MPLNIYRIFSTPAAALHDAEGIKDDDDDGASNHCRYVAVCHPVNMFDISLVRSQAQSHAELSICTKIFSISCIVLRTSDVRMDVVLSVVARNNVIRLLRLCSPK